MDLSSMEIKVANANIVKRAIVRAMIKEGYISEDKGFEFLDNYQVMLTTGTWFQNLYNTLFKRRDSNSWYYDVIKVINSDDLSSLNKSPDNIKNISDVGRLQEMLIEASKKENWELATIIRDRIQELEK